MDDAKPLSLAQRLIARGVKKSHAYQLADPDRTVSLKVALRIYDRTEIKIGPLAQATDKDVQTLRKFAPSEAAA